MIKTNIKMRVTPEQSERVQEICFSNGIYWADGEKELYFPLIDKICLIIKKSISFTALINYSGDGIEEIDADLFIKTNGICVETYLTKYTSQPKDLESALKKIENLHIALNKKVEKNKNQALEITKLLEQKKDLQEENERLLKHEQTLIDDLYKSQCKESDKFEEIKKLNTIISYLRSELK